MSPSKPENTAGTPNALIGETSAYLLQHAYNPVNWLPWKPESLNKAAAEDKLLLISIGYAACHWCHVMEAECFEDAQVAALMNRAFVPVKVDREERPDVDQIYMDALQLMTGSGGWPLNIVALPDGRPFWGATYLPREQWMQALSQLATLYKEQPEKVIEYAENLTEGLHRLQEGQGSGQANPLESEREAPKNLLAWAEGMAKWKQRFDPEYGSNRGAPKFMMPAQLDFLLHWAVTNRDEEVETHVNTSLLKMAWGGIYDQLGGGFSRYSVDARWHVPHFEKMLYDNAQLLGTYARGYAHFKNPLYQEIAQGIFTFLERELQAPGGGYYASLDADSLDARGESTEGAYYVWKAQELKDLLGSDFEAFALVYNVNEFGHWEAGNYVLIRNQEMETCATALQIDPEVLSQKMASCRQKLLDYREKRPRPGLDDKIICGWNGLLLAGLADAAAYLEGSEEMEQAATALAAFLLKRMRLEDGSLLHSIAKQTNGPTGFLEDYAALIDGLIRLYSLSGTLRWLEEAEQLTQYVLEHFSDPQQTLLYFTSDIQESLIRRSRETADNVIPSSNAIMALNLKRLGLLLGKTAWVEQAREMFTAVLADSTSYPAQYALWLQLGLSMQQPFWEVVTSGPEAKSLSRQLQQHYLPNTLHAFHEEPTDYPLFKGKFEAGSTRIFPCQQGSCQQPLRSMEAAIETIAAPWT
ncbi:hypothetical protein SAMN04490243_0601 [Robiginitalea myxolifaciens]|uniref:Spermatogenesis-associated protein 20-like TRX domain-containing protein n=1 Tax=Robiginitalea myxolifaciens TaxID=400055 RepID=A0A1I6FSY8_9FLAO|nr:thioredoxin domain-containing protein [Robiginitalea myxolifaciens]SFR33041.1 hypothetical protein SAMN04490243_0601 [Robiginitalea myxolifaciens]